MSKRVFISLVMTIITAGFVFSAQAQDTASAGTGLAIVRLAVAAGIEDREPVGAAEVFTAATPKVCCFLEAVGIAADTEVVFVWILNGTEILQTPMTLRAGSRWRTWADKNLYGMTGGWKVEVRDAAGGVLKAVEFKVE